MLRSHPPDLHGRAVVYRRESSADQAPGAEGAHRREHTSMLSWLWRQSRDSVAVELVVFDGAGESAIGRRGPISAFALPEGSDS